jgi:hypothetical protein
MEHGEIQLAETRGQRSDVRGQPPSPHGFGAPRRAHRLPVTVHRLLTNKLTDQRTAAKVRDASYLY